MNYVFSMGSSVIAVTAVLVAIWHVRTSAAASARSNALPVASAAFNEFRSKEFQGHLQAVWNQRPTEVPAGGFESLPETWRDSAYRVAYFFEYLGILVAHGLVPTDLIVDFSANLVVRSWRALEPFIEAERRHRRDTCEPANISAGFVTHFEHLVCLAFDGAGRPYDTRIHDRLKLRKVARTSRPPVVLDAVERLAYEPTSQGVISAS